MPRPRKKGEYVEEKARAKARLDAQDEHDSKLLTGKGQKRLVASIATHIGNAIDRIEPLEMAAVVGATIIVRNTIMNAPETLGYIRQKALGGELGYFEKLLLYGPINWPMFTAARELYGHTEHAVEEAIEKQGEGMIWVISFVVAYLCVKHFGLIVSTLGDIGKSILGITHMLLGIG